MTASRLNALNQALDIAGSLTQTSSLSLADEGNGLGSPISGQTGSTAAVSTVASGIATITGLTGFTSGDVGNFLTLSGANTPGNNGTFLIVAYNSATSVDIANASAVSGDTNNGSIVWTERNPYSLEDDLNYVRTDRAAIKGVAYTAAIPVYQRPTAIGTDVPANLSNISGKTTDAQGFIFPRMYLGQAVASGDGYVTVTSAGNFKHSDSVDKTGVPMFDVAPYSGNRQATLVHITNPANDNELTTTDGYKVIGFSRNGTTSVSPNSIEVVFYKVAHGADLSTAVAYTWENTLPVSIDLTYGYFTRLDQADENSFRQIEILGVQSDADLRRDVDDLQTIIGSIDDTSSLNGLLTNTGANYAFFNLPDATPSVVEALNTLNSQIGDRTYTGAILSSGQTIAASLQALSNAMAGTTITRTKEIVASTIAANTAHTLPGSISYTIDGTNNGRNMFVFWRGLLRDPGSVASGNDYAETSSTSITPYTKINAGDHINYFIKS